jgi:hypothetical protein
MTKAVDVQVGGDHYRKLPIQPMEYIQKNKLNFCEGSIVKYATRWRDKGGLQDLLKIKHCVDLLIEIEGLEEEEKVKSDPDFSKHPITKYCRAARKYGCTLPEGHSGPHIAEADKVLDTWED